MRSQRAAASRSGKPIADREGWRAVRCSRQGFFDLIEFWIENEVLIELLPPNLIEQYLHLVQPDNLKAALNLDLSSEELLGKE